jgi:hypothetical protein
LEFFGTRGSYVEVPASPQFDLNVYTVMFWVNPYELGRKQAIFAHGESFYNDEGHTDDNVDKAQNIIFLKEDGHLQHWSESEGHDVGSNNAHVRTKTDFYSTSDYEIRERSWTHVAITRGVDNAIMFYVNGQLDSHHTPELGFNDPHINHVLTFGCRTQGNGGYQTFFAGALDDIRFFNVEVSQATVDQVYTESTKVMCDSSALSEMMNTVNHMCCDDPNYVSIDCSSGVPSTCSVDCASAFLPLWRNCGAELDKNGADFKDFAAQCSSAESDGAVSECGYTELLPIMLTCSDISGVDFCQSACYSRLKVYMHACYSSMPPQAAQYIKTLETQIDTCGSPGTAPTDMGASCDIFSISHACESLSYEAIAPALLEQQTREKACEAAGNNFECTRTALSPQLETLCKSDCVQLVLGSYDVCSRETAVNILAGTQCFDAKNTPDHNGDGKIDIDDQQCTDRGALIINGTEVCDFVDQCKGPCSGDEAPELCDDTADAGPCHNGGVCIDSAHNTARLPFDADENMLLPEGHAMCRCTPGFTGRFCTCTTVDGLVNSCSQSSAKSSCESSLKLMDNELSALCHLGDLTDFDNADLPCSPGCANLFSPFYSICSAVLWPTCCEQDGSDFPTSGPAYEKLKAKSGIDPAHNQQVAAFNQKCAVAGGRADGQDDYCAAKSCEDCRNEDGCGWCSGREVCSNECFTSDGECSGAPTGKVDSCAVLTDCADCNKNPQCGWCQDGTRNVCSALCDTSHTVADCDAGNQNIHDGGADTHGSDKHGGSRGVVCDEDAWPDKDHGLVCGECKVLVNLFEKNYGGLCSTYCAAVGRTCVGAYEEVDDTCEVERVEACDQAFAKPTTDAICECGAETGANGGGRGGGH